MTNVVELYEKSIQEGHGRKTGIVQKTRDVALEILKTKDHINISALAKVMSQVTEKEVDYASVRYALVGTKGQKNFVLTTIDGERAVTLRNKKK